MLRQESSQRQRACAPTLDAGGSNADTPLYSSGLPALVEAMAHLGVPATSLLGGTGFARRGLADSEVRISSEQAVRLFANAQRLAPDPAIGLVAGQRQRIADLGALGYALLSSATLGQAVGLGIRHIHLAGPMVEKRWRMEGPLAVFEGHDTLNYGELLPLASEFWFASMQTVLSQILGRRFKAVRLMLPYPAPAHARRYKQVLGCAVEFAAPVMQWHVDAALLELPLPSVRPLLADVSAGFRERMLRDVRRAPELVTRIREACLNSAGDVPRQDKMAEQLNFSPRTLYRRLEEAGCGYQDIIDSVRQRLAIEYLERTTMSVQEVGARCGFSDVSNFRKAFRRWTGRVPAFFRAGRRR